jgi:hypothetical protein
MLVAGPRRTSSVMDILKTQSLSMNVGRGSRKSDMIPIESNQPPTSGHVAVWSLAEIFEGVAIHYDKLCNVLVTVSNTHGLVRILLTSPLHFY